ncbi:MAG: aminotransferase class V-fold PLP-dependent enzyme [Cellulosilyticaceae bacterium]|uniref:aminotransferase class I/II-fold pyridoxal phosphate-dependent enzyme n=1 Tax=Niameybacter sp. TaxID=2033640 RepID=UPI002FC8AFC5
MNTRHNQMPLYTALMEYSQHKKPFHMPGHKLGRFGDMKQIDYTALDVTEANGLDNLYEAEGIIEAAMDKMRKFYGAYKTIFLTNGSTAGILTSLMTMCKPGDEVLIARNCHHSVWHALILIGAVPIYIQPEYNSDLGLMTKVRKDTIQEALLQYPNVKGAIIVSPTYEGVVSDVKGIAEVLHQAGKALIVDEAHGAHFAVNSYFPTSSLKLGADLVIQSMHKTMPTLTQSALLHQGTALFSYGQLIQTLRMVQTSSPSYTLMATMDYARHYVEEHKSEIEIDYIKPLIAMRERLQNLNKLHLLNLAHEAYDISKIIIFTTHSGIDSYLLGQYLEERYQIVAEATLPHYVILMTTVADNTATLTELERALIEIDKELSLIQEPQVADLYCSQLNQIIDELPTIQKGVYTPREVHYGMSSWQTLKYCLGKVAAQTIMFYPPGIPILYMGEAFQERHLMIIEQYANRLKGIQYSGTEIHCKVLDIPLK